MSVNFLTKENNFSDITVWISFSLSGIKVFCEKNEKGYLNYFNDCWYFGNWTKLIMNV